MPSDDRSPNASGNGRPGKAPASFFTRVRRVFSPATSDRNASAEGTEGQPQHNTDLVDQAEAFQTLRVSDVMTPRADIVALELTTPFGAVVRQFAESEHSRMPVYRETLDEPVGVVHIKDVFKLLQPHGAMTPPALDEAVLRRLRREVLYVPASMRAADLLLRMQARRIHMALVIDEFGGTDGLVTMENLIEAVVGDIDDEHDVAAPGVVSAAGGVFEADARAALEDLETALGMTLAPDDPDEEIDTVGGLVVTIAGRVPQRGEVVLHPKGFELEVVDADPRRVKRVRIRAPATAAEPPTPESSAT